MSIWDTSTNPGVRKAFGQKVPTKPTADGEVEDRLVGINDEESSSDDDDDEEDDEDDDGAALSHDGDSMDEDED
jgi:periodic tryptophan protein 1